MVSFFINRLVSNRENISDPSVRRAYGEVCGIYGIAINVLLFLGKLVVGILSGSAAVIADALNNLSDAGSSIVSLAGFRLAAHAPDREHPFGHGRFEYISGMLISSVIVLMGFGLLRSGAEGIISPTEIDLSPALIAVLIASVLLKLYMAFYNNKYGKMLNSSSMRAAAADSLSDCAATGAVLLSSAVSALTSLNIDGWACLLVSVLIIIAGIKSFRETVDPLLGKAPDKDFVGGVKSIVMSHDEALGIHDLAVHDYGPGHTMVSLHVEVDGSGNIYALHESIDAMEREISEKLGCEAIIHMDPVDEADPRLEKMKAQTLKLLRERIDAGISIHDFRIVPCPNGTRLIFDAAVPSKFGGDADGIKKKIEALVRESFEGCTAETKIDLLFE